MMLQALAQLARLVLEWAERQGDRWDEPIVERIRRSYGR
jgi:hypothetical protein